MRTISLILVLLTACSKKTNEQPAAEPQQSEVAATQKESTPAKQDPPSEEIKPAPPLTEEEKALIAKDPADLTPEMRRKRAYALRKKVMQNPNSPLAIELREGGERIRRGEMQVPDFSKTDTRASTDSEKAE